MSLWARARLRAAAGVVACTGLAAAGLGVGGLPAAPAGALGVAAACGPGAGAHNCPPLCARLAASVEPSKYFHVLFAKPQWRLYGEPQDVCTYAEAHEPSSSVTDELDAHQTLADFEDQVNVTKKFDRGAIVEAVPALGSHAVDIVHCIGTGSSAWCYADMVVFKRGFLAQAGEALGTVNIGTMGKVYVPELVAWLKALLAKAER